MKIFPNEMKQTTKYILLIIVSLAFSTFGTNLGNNIALKTIAFLLFWAGLIGLIIELIKKAKRKK